MTEILSFALSYSHLSHFLSFCLSYSSLSLYIPLTISASAISVGETILRRRAATLLNSHSYRYVGDSARSRSTADSHFVTLNRQARSEQRQRGELEEEEDSDYESPCTTSSMQYVEAYGDVFLLQNWLRYGDLGDIIPNNFVSPPSSRGVLMTDSISTQLGALHKSLHMHVILGRSDSFAADYRAMRLPVIGNFFKQAEKAMKQKGSLTTVLPTLLASVTGFFLFERIFQHCAVYKNGPFSNIELAALWDELCSKVDQFLSSNLRRLVSPEQVLLIKEELLLFIETTNDAIFHSKNTVISNNNNKLFIVLSNCWDAFENLQVTAATSRCKLELDGCQYQSLYVETEAEYISLIKSFRIQNLMYDEGRNSDLALGSEIVLSSTSVGSSTGTGREEGNANKASSTGNAMFRIHSEGKIDTKGTINSTASTVQRSHGSVGAATAALDAMEENLGSKVPLNANTLSLKPDPHAASRPKQSEDGRRDDQKGVFLPVTYPFSSAIPGILRQVHLLVLRYFIFAVKNPQLDQKGEALCSSVLKVYRFLNSSFKEELERGGSDTPLSKACQV